MNVSGKFALLSFHKLCVIYAQEYREIWMKQFSRAIIMILSTLEKQNVLRGRTFDFLGGMGDFRKKISCRLISRRKSSCKEVPGHKKFLHWKNISFMEYNAGKKILHRCMSGKKFYLQRFRKKKFLPKSNHPYPSSKSQMVGP